MALLYLSKFLTQRIWKWLLFYTAMYGLASYAAIATVSFSEMASGYMDRGVQLSILMPEGKSSIFCVVVTGMISQVQLVALSLASISGYSLWLLLTVSLFLFLTLFLWALLEPSWHV